MTRGLVLITALCCAIVSHPSVAEDSLALAKKKGCMGCHSLEMKGVGPAWREVAKKYRDDPAATNTLVASILYSSMGKWGERPMRGHAKRVNKAQATQLAEYILSLDKE